MTPIETPIETLYQKPKFMLSVICQVMTNYKIGKRNYRLEYVDNTYLRETNIFIIRFNGYSDRGGNTTFDFRIKIGRRNGKISLKVYNLNKHKKNQKRKYISIGGLERLHQIYLRWKLGST